MRKNKKRILALFLVFCMSVAFLVACANDDGATTPINGEEIPLSGSDDGGNAGEGFITSAWNEPFPEMVTFEIAFEQSAHIIFPEGDDYDDNIWLRAMRDRLNIDIVNIWTSADYDMTMNMAIASQELPDIFRVSNTQFVQLLEAGMIADLTDAFAAHASPRLADLHASSPEVVNSTMVDGRLMGLPRFGFGNNIDVPRFMFLRDDWMAEMGYDSIDSVEHLEEILHRMNAEFGVNGMVFENSLWDLWCLAPSWHAYPTIWVTGESGEIEWGGVQPEMRNFLEDMARWYDEGLINPVFVNLDFDGVVQAIAGGDAGAHPFQQWAGWVHSRNSVENNGPEAVLMPFTVPTIDGRQLLHSREFDNGGAVIVANANSPHAAEALVKLSSMFMHITNDSFPYEYTMEEYEMYIMNDIGHLPTWAVRNAFGEIEQYIQVQEAFRTGSQDHFTNIGALQKYYETISWLEDQEPEGLGAAVQLGFPERSAYAQAFPFVENDWFMNCRMWGSAPEEWLELQGILNDILLEGFVRIITGVESIEHFDALVASWYAAGGDRATAAVRAMYD